VSDRLRNRLQAALSGSYRLDRELGGGAMSRVFVAHETARGTLQWAIDDSIIALWFRNDRATAARIMDEALRRHPLESFAWADRPYTGVAMAYALLGQPDRARAVQPAFKKSREKPGLAEDLWERPILNGFVAVGEKRHPVAVEEVPRSSRSPPRDVERKN